MPLDPASAPIGRSPKAATAVLVAVALAAAGLWWLDAADEPAIEPAARADQVAPELLPTSFADVEKPAEPAPGAAVVGGDDEIQLCGGHWVRAGPDGKPTEDAFDAVVANSLDEVSRSTLGLMEAAAALRVRAAAHYFRAGSVAAMANPSQERRSEAAAHREALARLAQVSDDVQVYAWAYRACRGVGAASPGACMQITAAQWARLEPENAEPWLAAAEEARRRKDGAALDDAMFHVAAAGRHQPGSATLAATVAEYAPSDERALVGTYAAIVQALGVESTHGTEWHAAVEYCSAREIADANRRETCERVAAVLVDRSTTVLARATGIGIGRRLGWSADRLDALAALQDAETTAMVLRTHDPAQTDITACGPLRANIERVRAEAELGEIEMLRRDVAASGYSIARLAAEARRQREREGRPAAVEAAASAASAPPAPDALAAAGAETVAQR